MNVLKNNYLENTFDAIGIASFGPLRLKGKFRGTIISKPSDKKTSWCGVNLVELMERLYPGKEVRIDTDVNCSVLGEY